MRSLFDKVSMSLIVFAVFALLLYPFISLGWAMSHPSKDVNIECIRSGYQYAEQDTFSNDVYCVKTIRVNINDVEGLE